MDGPYSMHTLRQDETRCLYYVECPKYSIQLEALCYLCDCVNGRGRYVTTFNINRGQYAKVNGAKCRKSCTLNQQNFSNYLQQSNDSFRGPYI